MTTFTLAFGKANASGTRKALTDVIRLYSTSTVARLAEQNLQRGLVVDVLTANATKRDAKQYLARFKSPRTKPSLDGVVGLSESQQERSPRQGSNQDRLDRAGVNLGTLYGPSRAIAESPTFTQPHVAQSVGNIVHEEELHVALVSLRAPETLSDAILDGVALTLSQLVKLDMQILLVLDCDGSADGWTDENEALKYQRQIFAEQGARLSAALAHHGTSGGRIVSDALEFSIQEGGPGSNADANRLHVGIPRLLIDPLARGVIPIVPSVAYTAAGRLIRVPITSVMCALTSALSATTKQQSATKGSMFSVDRIILLDVLGGIPSKARGDGAHVFINLEQEYEDIESELQTYRRNTDQRNAPASSKIYEQHSQNLATARACLVMLPSASSALVVTPQEAASSSQTDTSVPHPFGAGTRRQKNTLIHNLLTNKPMVSSSLPVARLRTSLTNSDSHSQLPPTSTLIKRGMPVTIIPEIPRGDHFRHPNSGRTTLSLQTDPQVDFPRLVHLINSSFRRTLDVEDYLSRIHDRIAGLIIAGEYEGAAILTWEAPSSSSSPDRLVPYLDKFAVLPSSQGSSGVADIVFQAMVRTCFPHGVCWRSRRDNPVNKWYFERSAGTWEIPGSQWTMFWTGEGVVEDRQRWEDYVSVCRSVKPSWADRKAPD